jgi:hypothetical protein
LNKVDTMIDPTYMDVLEYCKDQPLSRDRLMEIFCDYIYVHRGSCTRSKQLRISSFSFNINSIAAYYEFLWYTICCFAVWSRYWVVLPMRLRRLWLKSGNCYNKERLCQKIFQLRCSISCLPRGEKDKVVRQGWKAPRGSTLLCKLDFYNYTICSSFICDIDHRICIFMHFRNCWSYTRL